MALLFRSTVDSAARWQAELAQLTPELDIRIWPEIGDPAGHRIRARLAARAGAAGRAAEPEADPVARRGRRPHPVRPAAAPRSADRPPGRPLSDGRDERIRGCCKCCGCTAGTSTIGLSSRPRSGANCRKRTPANDLSGFWGLARSARMPAASSPRWVSRFQPGAGDREPTRPSRYSPARTVCRSCSRRAKSSSACCR